jgi:hypothetical protein
MVFLRQTSGLNLINYDARINMQIRPRAVSILPENAMQLLGVGRWWRGLRHNGVRTLRKRVSVGEAYYCDLYWHSHLTKMEIDEELCKSCGLDPKRVRSIATRISKAAKEADAMGLTVFGGSTGSLRYSDVPLQGPGNSEVAILDGSFDGGDGGDVF